MNKQYVLMGLALSLVMLISAYDPKRTTKPMHVVCHSGGSKIIDDYSVDKSSLTWNGLTYVSQTTKTEVQTNAECTILDEPRFKDWQPLLPARSG